MEVPAFKGSAGARMILLLVLYTVTLSISLWLAYQLRFDFDVPEVPVNFRAQMVSIVLWVIPLKLLLLWFFRQFAGLLSYFSIPDLTRLFYSVGLSSATLAAVRMPNKASWERTS